MSFQSSSIFFNSDTLAAAAETDSATAVEEKDVAKSEKQRGMWSFLTWAFFLANFLTAAEIQSGAAHAAVADGDLGDGHSHSDDDATHVASAALPEVQHAVLESAPTEHTPAPADGGVTLDAIELAAGDLPALVEVEPLSAHGNISGGAFTAAEAAGDGSSTTNNYYSIDSHDTTDTTINNYITIDGHDVLAPVTVIASVIPTVIGDLGQAVSGVTSAVEGVVDTTLHTVASVVGDVVPDVISSVDGIVTTTTSLVGDLAHSTFDTTINAVGDTLPTLTSSVDHLVGGAGASLDILGNTMSSLGISSPGSLSFAADTPASIAAYDNAPSGPGYSQYNIALQDVMSDADASPLPTVDTGAITTIITSAIGIDPHHASEDAPAADHSGDQLPGHISVLDDLHSPLHSGLFG